eukprot:5486512-Prymnesium_polylepis.1
MPSLKHEGLCSETLVRARTYRFGVYLGDKRAGGWLGWAGSGVGSSGGGSEGVLCRRNRAPKGEELAGSQGRTRARAGTGRPPMVRGVGGGVPGRWSNERTDKGTRKKDATD